MVADTVYYARRRMRAVARTVDVTSRMRMLRLQAESVVGRESDHPSAATAVPVRVHKGDRLVWLRPRSRDRVAFEFLEEGHHLPPPEMAGPVRHIAIFGANIGLPLADLADRYPEARLLGVEPDVDNAVLARRNTEHLGGRATIVEAAVWHRDADLEVTWERDAWGVDLSGGVTPDTETEPMVVRAVDAGALLHEWTGGAPVDYLLVNIESAWYEMLKHGEWTQDVRCLQIEIQAHYDEAVPLLERLGYTARLRRLDWGAFAIGVRN